ASGRRCTWSCCRAGARNRSPCSSRSSTRLASGSSPPSRGCSSSPRLWLRPRRPPLSRDTLRPSAHSEARDCSCARAPSRKAVTGLHGSRWQAELQRAAVSISRLRGAGAGGLVLRRTVQRGGGERIEILAGGVVLLSDAALQTEI